MKFLVLVMFLVVGVMSGCSDSEVLDDGVVNRREIVVMNYVSAPEFEVIESQLVQVELEAGLGNLDVASQLFENLLELIDDVEIENDSQRSRINTMHIVLADTLAQSVGENVADFSGSAAAIKVMNLRGQEDGFLYVYHAIPSFVGSSAIGYYVFLIAEEDENQDPLATFFVTSDGDVLEIH